MNDIPANLPGWIAQHIKLYLEDPEKAHLWDASMAGGKGRIPTLLLIHTGRMSGAELMLPLIYGEVDGGYAIVASKGGAPNHPAWYLNLLAHPDCEIRVGATSHQVRARIAEGVERKAIWNQMVEVYAPYTAYQAATERTIPVVVLEIR